MDKADKLVELTNKFHYHAPKDEATLAAHQLIRHSCFEAAKVVLETVPIGREQSLALTKIEEAMFWANAGIARK